MEKIEEEFLRDIQAFEFATPLKEKLKYQAKTKGVRETILIHNNTSQDRKELISAGYVNGFYSPVALNIYVRSVGNRVVYATPDEVRIGLMNKDLKSILSSQVKSLKKKLPKISRDEVPKVFSLIEKGVEPNIVYEYLKGSPPSDLEGRILQINGQADGLQITDFLGAVAFLTQEDKVYVEIAREMLEAGYKKGNMRIVTGELGDPYCLALPGRPVCYFALRRAAEMGSKIEIIAGPIAIVQEPLIKPEYFHGKTFKLSDGTKVVIDKESKNVAMLQEGASEELKILDSVQIANNLAYLVSKGLPIDFAIFVNKGVLTKEPDNFFGNYNLGNLLGQDGRYKESVDYLEIAREILLKSNIAIHYDGKEEPKSHIEAVILNNIGFARMMIGEYQMALEMLHKAIEINPKNIFSHNNVGTVHQILGDYGIAREYYLHELEINPSHLTAKKSIKRVEFLQNALK